MIPSVANNNPVAEHERLLCQGLISQGLINEDEAVTLRNEAQAVGDPLEVYLHRQNRITEEQLAECVEKLYGLRYVKLASLPITDTCQELLPPEFVAEKWVMPISCNGGRLDVAVVYPKDRSMVDEITFMTGMRPNLVVTSVLEFLAFNQIQSPEGHTSQLKDRVSETQTSNLLAGITNTTEMLRKQSEAEMNETNNPLVRLVNSIIHEAIDRNASDIHIEPRKNNYCVRYRIDGILAHILDIPESMEASLITRIKVMSRMDISDYRRPQDGRSSITYKKSDYNLRINTLPVGENREKVVIRILRPSKHITTFADLGFEEQDMQQLEDLCQLPHGIVLVCGPTGSGKTTTLYTVLHKINEESRNISTVEDPVELRIEGLNQSQVNPKADYTFANSMRALLRQDPDVIMVGEIRDYETLEAAIHASLTGHLVFSTIHSNNTCGTITRMIEMGTSANLIASALNGVIAQRLVRTLCPHCKTPYKASREEKALLFLNKPEKIEAPLTLQQPVGCNRCNNSGYLGRVGLYEILRLDRELKHLISTGQSDMEIEDAAISGGMTTLGTSARLKVLQGFTTLEEVCRVLGPTLSS